MSGRQCGKLRFESEREAERALVRARDSMKRAPVPKKPQRAYPCPKCRGWHLTSAASTPTTRGTAR